MSERVKQLDILTNFACTELHAAFSGTTQKMKFSIKNFFSKCHQTHRKLRIWSHLLKKSLMENFIFVQCGLIRGLRHCYTYYFMRTIPDILHLSNPLDDAIDIFIKDILAIQLIMSYFHYHQNTVELD